MEQILITPAQCRMARSLLNWTQTELAEKCNLSPVTVTKFEKSTGDQALEIRTLEKLRKTLESGGVEFLPNEGVCRKSTNIQILHGAEGFWRFYTDVYETVKNSGGEILVSNVDETYFVKWLGDKQKIHRDRMYALGNYKLKILIQEGDYNFVSQYKHVEYRWMPRHEYVNVPFYAYGDKLAIIDFEENDVTVFIHDHPKISAAFKKIFNANWEKSITPRIAGE